MKAKTFLALLVVAGLLVALAWFRIGGDKRMQGSRMGDPLFSDLPINQVAAVTIADADNQTTLTKGDAMWRVESRGGYPADFDALRDTVVKLSRLKIGRSFPATPESVARLSLLPPAASQETARGTRITLKDATGTILADVILGQSRQTGAGGQYVKMAADDTVFLVDNSFRFLKTAPADWLDKEILDVKADEVAAVTCYAGGDETPLYRLTRPEKGRPAELTPVPEGRIADVSKIDQVMDVLAPLTLDDVQAAAEPPADDGTRLVYRLYDGREITLRPITDGKERYSLRVTVRDVAPLETGQDAAAATDAGEDAQPATAEVAAPAPATAGQLDQALRPWVFDIKKWQYDSLIVRPEALLQAEEG